MEKYSCWDFPYRKRYYLTHPWKWFKDLWRNIRDVHMRAKYGFCWSDVWNWDNWFLHVAPQMLRHMAKEGCAYPGNETFNTPERWHDWLNEVADLLDTGREDWQDQHNEYYEQYMKELATKWQPWIMDENGNYHWPAPNRTELDDKFYARSRELAEQGEDNVRRAMEMLGEHFFSIWD